jgi:hypothetical protein
LGILGGCFNASNEDDDTNLNVLINKYELAGVRDFITFSRKMEIIEKNKNVLQKFKEDTLWKEVSRPGCVVFNKHRPRVGTKVCNRRPIRGDNAKNKGVIIANDEMNGTAIGVRWDSGIESHGLQCGVRGLGIKINPRWGLTELLYY